MTSEKNYILSQAAAQKKLERMALEILEDNFEVPQLILIGIQENGYVIARRLQHMLQGYGKDVLLVSLILNKKEPVAVKLDTEMDFTNKVIILVDDVSNSGKTLTYSLKPFLEYHPAKIATLVLVERSHTAFPVRPDYVGLSLATTLQEQIMVEVAGDEVVGAYLM